MRAVFVDTGAFFAQLDRSDQFQRRAVELFAQARSERWRLVTTNATVFETHALLLSRTSRSHAVLFLDLLRAGLCQIERVQIQDEMAAEALIRQHADKGYSFCDAMSFVVMERLGISEAMAFDDHFRQYGRFTVL